MPRSPKPIGPLGKRAEYPDLNAYLGKPIGPSDWEYGLWLPATHTLIYASTSLPSPNPSVP